MVQTFRLSSQSAIDDVLSVFWDIKSAFTDSTHKITCILIENLNEIRSFHTLFIQIILTAYTTKQKSCMYLDFIYINGN